ncbi:kinase-like domain-containing protein [Glomus cerebriforme]|uniref:Kinase-like domain-containing protein n=1 Tax=Glomus cerebriforme TaxID=658196 RepID=A0A397T6M1_9GLOM|nr:kinase-like domain-containing protein [Glomus cerebriforme]
MSDFLISNNPFLLTSNVCTCEDENIEDFIRHTNPSGYSKMEFVSYDKFKDVEFISEGGFSKIYKATWINGPRNWSAPLHYRIGNMTVALKELNNSNSKELKELKIFYNYATSDGYAYDDHSNYISKYFGVTRHPFTQNFMIITKYYELGDLTNYISNNFYNTSWFNKLIELQYIMSGLKNMHDADIIHKDYHSGNILLTTSKIPIVGDLGLNKSALSDNDNEIYGIYSFGMIMWELMTGRRPFWNQNHNTDLIIEIWDGLRPPIVTNAPEGYIELMKECWHPDSNKRPTVSNLQLKVRAIWENEIKNNSYKNPTEIIKSSDIGPITTNNPGAIYKSRPLSAMIKSAKSTVNLRSQNNISKIVKNDKRKFDDDLIEDNNKNDKNFKKIKLLENEKNGYSMELDIDIYLL